MEGLSQTAETRINTPLLYVVPCDGDNSLVKYTHDTDNKLQQIRDNQPHKGIRPVDFKIMNKAVYKNTGQYLPEEIIDKQIPLFTDVTSVENLVETYRRYYPLSDQSVLRCISLLNDLSDIQKDGTALPDVLIIGGNRTIDGQKVSVAGEIMKDFLNFFIQNATYINDCEKFANLNGQVNWIVEDEVLPIDQPLSASTPSNIASLQKILETTRVKQVKFFTSPAQNKRIQQMIGQKGSFTNKDQEVISIQESALTSDIGEEIFRAARYGQLKHALSQIAGQIITNIGADALMVKLRQRSKKTGTG